MNKASKRKRAAAARAAAAASPAPAGQQAGKQTADQGSSRPAATPGSRLEFTLVAVVLLCGVVLRIAVPEHMAVEHFDEGVYASNLWFDTGQYPARHLYAPSLVPALIEASLLAEQVVSGPATRPTGVAAMLPNLLAGCLTLLIVWWVTRRWFGSAAGIGATTLAALSEFHALFTRTALTDVLLLPWMLLAVFLFERAVATRHVKLLVLAGLACGLAWWTKYNGWLPLLIALGGLVLRVALVRKAWRSLPLDLGYWAIFAFTAAVVWSPYLWSLQATGGYAPVMANHRGYVVGVAGWPASFTHQLANITHFEGWPSCLAPAAALLFSVLLLCRHPGLAASRPVGGRRLDVLRIFCLAATATALATWLGLAVVLSFLSILGLVALGLRQQATAGGDDPTDGLAGWLVASWFAGLFVMTPLYSPYPRLTLTWLCASWLAGGLGVVVLGRGCLCGGAVGRLQNFAQLRVGRFAMGAGLIVAVTATWWASWPVTARGVPSWQDRGGLRDAATTIVQQIDVAQSIVFVQGEPGLFYQLRAAGVAAVPGIDASLATGPLPAGVTAYLATGLHADRSDAFQQVLAQARSRLEDVVSIPYQPSDLVLLNNFRAHQLEEQQRAAWSIRLYRLK